MQTLYHFIVERLKLNNDSKIKDYRPQIDSIIEELLKPANKTKFGDYVDLCEPGNVIKIDKCYKIIYSIDMTDSGMYSIWYISEFYLS